MRLTACRSLAAAIAAAMTCVPLAFAAGPASAQVVKTSTVDHWGTFFGQKKPGGNDTKLRPAAMTVPGHVVEIGTSNSTDYALLANGDLYAWGQGSHGELGDGRLGNSFTRPVRVRFPAGVRIKSIPIDVMPFDTGLAIDTTGHVWGWGFNYGGELCLGSARVVLKRPVRLPFAHVTKAAGASDHAIYDAAGKLYMCGTNDFGELGDGNFKTSFVPVRVRHLSGARIAALVASYGNTGALLKNGNYYNWGLDSRGQLGDGTVGHPSDLPVKVSLPGPVKLASLGGSLGNNGQTLVQLANGMLFAWGDDKYGQLGNGTTGDEPSPVPFSPPVGVTYASLATSGATSYAISTSGDVYAWGASSQGQVGDGSRSAALTPVKVDSGATAISGTAADVAALIG